MNSLAKWQNKSRVAYHLFKWKFSTGSYTSPRPPKRTIPDLHRRILLFQLRSGYIIVKARTSRHVNKRQSFYIWYHVEILSQVAANHYGPFDETRLLAPASMHERRQGVPERIVLNNR